MQRRKEPPMNRNTSAAALTTLSLLLVGCAQAGPGGSGSDAGANPYVALATSALAPVDIPSGAHSIIYAVPAADPHDDGSLFLHIVGSDPADDAALGQGTDAIAIPAAGSPKAVAHMQWYNSETSKISVERPDGAGASAAVADAGVPLTSLDVDGLRYFQVGDK